MGEAVSSDEASTIAESLVHIHGVIPSLTALDALMLQEKERRLGTLTEVGEIEAMRASGIVSTLNHSEVLVLRDVRGLDHRPPTVLVSLRRFPDADRAFVLAHLRPLRALGSPRDRRDALESPVTEALTGLLVPYDFRVARRSDEFHSVCNDVTVIGPRRRLFNIELRNRRTHVHDRLLPVDADAIARDARLGITTMFVVPRGTHRFQRQVAHGGGVVVETGVYVTTTDEQRRALEGFSWMTWPVKLGADAAPRIAEQIADVILTPEDQVVHPPEDSNAKSPATAQPMTAREIESEIRRYLKAGGSVERVLEAMELYRLGVPKMADAANIVGCRRQTLVDDFKKCGQQSPWRRGGRRRGAGRKSKSPS